MCSRAIRPLHVIEVARQSQNVTSGENAVSLAHISRACRYSVNHLLLIYSSARKLKKQARLLARVNSPALHLQRWPNQNAGKQTDAKTGTEPLSRA